jgi:alpha-glucosidase (family GH31 glycosyl hydrolase)
VHLHKGAELCTRWQQLGALVYGFYRNHNTIGAPEQAPFVFGEPYTTIIRDAMLLRYSLVPYIYTQFHLQHALGGVRVTRPMMLAFPDQAVALGAVDRQVVFGDALMVAPVMEQGATQLTFWAPDPASTPAYDWNSGAVVLSPSGGGNVTINVNLSSLPVYALGGHIVPTQQPEQAVDLMQGNTWNLTVALPAPGNVPTPGQPWGQLFLDDGVTPDTYENNNFTFVNYTATGVSGSPSGTITAAVGPKAYSPPASEVLSVVRIFGVQAPAGSTNCTFSINSVNAQSISLDRANAVLTAVIGSGAPRINQPFSASWAINSGTTSC